MCSDEKHFNNNLANLIYLIVPNDVQWYEDQLKRNINVLKVFNDEGKKGNNLYIRKNTISQQIYLIMTSTILKLQTFKIYIRYI